MVSNSLQTSNLLYSEAEAHEDRFDFERAKDSYCEIFRKSKFTDATSLAGYANILLKQRQVSAATFCYEMALEIIDENAEKFAFQQDLSLYRKLSVNLLVCYQALGYHTEAINLCNKLLEKDGEWLQAKLLKSFFLAELGRTREAVEYISQCDDDDVKTMSESLIAFGSAFLAEKDWKAAGQYFHQCVSEAITAGSPCEPMKFLAISGLISAICELTDDFAMAEAEFNKVVKNVPKTEVAYEISRTKSILGFINDLKPSTNHALEITTIDRYRNIFSGLSSQLDEMEFYEETREGFITPTLSRETIRRNLSNLTLLAQDFVEEGFLEPMRTNIQTFHEKFSFATNHPVFILSTGRAGTAAMHNFFNETKNVQSYHTFSCNVAPCDRNHILYRIITGALDRQAIRIIYVNYLRARTAEFLFAYRQGKIPVIVNHWDTVFAPVNAIVFPDSRFIYLKRDSNAVATSLFSKNQWRNRQLQYWWFDPNYPDGEFRFFRDTRRTIGAEIAWYLYTSDLFSKTIVEDLVPNRSIKLFSEALFNVSDESYSNLKQFLPDIEFNKNTFKDIFGKVRNSKTGLLMETDAAVKDVLKEYTRQTHALNETGMLTPV